MLKREVGCDVGGKLEAHWQSCWEYQDHPVHLTGKHKVDCLCCKRPDRPDCVARVGAPEQSIQLALATV